jgi:Ca-activated chloride channel family protein
MKIVVLVILSLLVWVDPATVKRINAAKSAAEEAFKRGDYSAAVAHYKFLVDSIGVNEDAVLLNFANAHYLAKDTASALTRYQQVMESPQNQIRSKAHQQLGILANQQGRAEEALKHFKEAIKAEPTNDDARYNYEMLKKKLEEKKKEQEEQQQKNKDQQKQDQQNQDQQNKEEEQKDQEKDQEKKDEQNKDQQQKEQEQKEKEQQEKEQEQQEKDKPEQQEAEEEEMPNLDREKLEEMKISEEKARMILEAMKNQEKQYLQQQKRKPTQSRDRNKPDW